LMGGVAVRSDRRGTVGLAGPRRNGVGVSGEEAVA